MIDTENAIDILALKYLLFWQTRKCHKPNSQILQTFYTKDSYM